MTLTRRRFLTSGSAAVAASTLAQTPRRLVNFWVDGVMPSPEDYAATIRDLTESDADVKDRYGLGGAVERLEKRFATLTGKERGLFLPSGTMANQLAIRVLSGDTSTVVVQDLSHVFRDEADAARMVHGKQLVPLAPGRGVFTASELEDTVGGAHAGGVLSIEIPVLRADAQAVPFEELRRICAFARSREMGLHLDGARLFLASEYSGVALDGYAALFDTVYISLYKYLRAPAGAVLCGSEDVIERVAHLRKLHGGNMYQNWPNAAVALHFLDGFTERFANARTKADTLFTTLERTGRFEITPIPNGSNIFRLHVTGADPDRFRRALRETWNVGLKAPDENGLILVHVNETQLDLSNEALVEAFEDAHRSA